MSVQAHVGDGQLGIVINDRLWGLVGRRGIDAAIWLETCRDDLIVGRSNMGEVG